MPSVVALPGIELLICDPVVVTSFIGSGTVDLSTLFRPGAMVLTERRDKSRCLCAKFCSNVAEFNALIWDSVECCHQRRAFVVVGGVFSRSSKWFEETAVRKK